MYPMESKYHSNLIPTNHHPLKKHKNKIFFTCQKFRIVSFSFGTCVSIPLPPQKFILMHFIHKSFFDHLSPTTKIYTYKFKFKFLNFL